MQKRNYLILIIFGIFLVSLVNVNALSISFTDPTPANDTSDNVLKINTTNDAVSQSYSFLDYDDLALWLRMENSSFVDYSGNNFNPNWISSPSVETGKFGNSGFFNSTQTDYGTIGYSSLLMPLGDSCTYSFWLKTDSSSGMDIINTQSAVDRINLRYLSSTSFRTYLRDESVAQYKDYSVTLGNDEWNLVTIVIDRGLGYVRFYVNAEEIEPSSRLSLTDINYIDTSALSSIGTTANKINGNLDEFLFIKRALTAQEVQYLYNSTSNSYYEDLSEIAKGGEKSYSVSLINSTGDLASTENRTFTMQESISTIYSPINNSGYVNSISSSLLTNFEASCSYNIDDGSNQSMTTTDNYYHSATISLTELGEKTINFFCNNSDTIVQEQRIINSLDHVILYVDKNHAGCSDSYSRAQAAIESTPVCSISSGISLLTTPGDELVIKNGTYSEGVSSSRSGNSTDPIIIRGESNSLRPILDGTSAVLISGIIPTGDNYCEFKYFDVFNFSNDCINNHGSGIGVLVENITCRDNGFAHNSAAGDGVSFHDNTSGIGKWINVTNGYKSLIVDIINSQTNYSNVFGNNNRLYGIFFYGTGSGRGSVPNDISYHYVWNATIENSPGCFWSEVKSNGYNLNCVNISGEAIYLANRENSVEGFNISTTNPISINISNAENYRIFIKDGITNNNISISNSSNVEFVNVTYDNEFISANSNLTRKWYLTVGSTQEDVLISIEDSEGTLLYSNTTTSENLVFDKQTLTGYTNDGGSSINKTYTITASKDNYVNQSQNLTLSDNTLLLFTLTEIEESLPESEYSWGGYYIFKPTEEEVNSGYSAIMYINQKILFKVEDESHNLKLESINKETAKIIIYSEPQEAILSIGEEKEFDISGDDNYDLLVVLNSIDFTNKYAPNVKLTITAISEDLTSEKIQEQEEDEQIIETEGGLESITGRTIFNPIESKTTFLSLIFIAAAIIIILVLIFYNRLKK